MATKLKFSIILMACLSLTSCLKSQPNPAECRVNQQFLSPHVAGGACIIKINNRLMVMIDRDSKVNIPVQQKIPNKSAQCAAHQSVWQHTGFNVEVGPRLGSLRRDLELFACELDAGFDGSEIIETPSWTKSPNLKLTFVNPYDYSPYDWINPNDLEKVLDAFVTVENTQQLFNNNLDK